ncbi:MAG: O-antigen ligase family protein, partial [Bacteroidia bacterium]|nr:O-antigen ligase family protein [Bacteroidia bacterium]
MKRKFPAINLKVVLIILFLCFPFVYLPYTTDPEITLRYLCLAGLLLYISIALTTSKTLNFKYLQNPIALSVLAYGLIAGVAVFRSVNTGDGFYEFCKILTMVLLFFLMSVLLSGKKDSFKHLCMAITGGILIFNGIALIQVLPLILDSIENSTIFSVGDKVHSTLSNKNFYAETLLLSIPFICYNFINSHKWKRTMSFVALISSLLYIIILKCVAVYIGLAFMVLLFLIWIIYLRKNTREPLIPLLSARKTGVALILGFTIVISAFYLFKDKFHYEDIKVKIAAIGHFATHPEMIFKEEHSLNNNSVYDRLFLARNSLKMFAENPVLGNGLANWRIYFPKYQLFGNSYWAYGKLRYEHPHNEYLFMLAETGVVGLLCWLMILFFTFRALLKGYKSAITFDEKIKIATLATGIISFALLSFFGYPKERFFSLMIFIILIATVAANYCKVKNVDSRPSYSATFSIFIIVVTAFISFIHFQHFKSEIHLRNALDAQLKKDLPEMQFQATKATNAFHQLDITGTPIEWYIGHALYHQNNHKQAYTHYKKAAAQNPWHMQVLNDYGALEEERGNHTVALEMFNRVQSINPDFM